MKIACKSVSIPAILLSLAHLANQFVSRCANQIVGYVSMRNIKKIAVALLSISKGSQAMWSSYH